MPNLEDGRLKPENMFVLILVLPECDICGFEVYGRYGNDKNNTTPTMGALDALPFMQEKVLPLEQ